MRISEFMTRDPAWCVPGTTAQEAAVLMRDHDCGAIPVVEDENTLKLVGVITDRDIVMRSLAVGRDPVRLSARDVMSSPVVTLSPEHSVEECGRLLEEHRIRRAPVVDAGGRCCGIVAQADLARRAPERITASVVRHVSEQGAGAATRSSRANES